MRARRHAALLALGASIAAIFSACGGDPFSTAATGDGGGSDAPGLDASGDGTGTVDGADAGHDAASSDAPGDHATADAPSPQDAPTGDAIVADAVTIDTGGVDAPPDTIVVGPSKIIFITSNAQSGALGGLAGADGICQ